MPLYDRTYSEEADEIIGTMPSWIVRWGITLIFVLLALLFLGCYFIRYPQTVTGTITLTTVPPPVDVTAPHTGIAEAVATEGQTVAKGDVLVLYATRDEYREVQHLEKSLWLPTDETLPDIRQSKRLALLYGLSLDELIEFDLDIREIQGVIDRTSETVSEKIDWTKAWSKKYPVLARYQSEVDIPYYAAGLWKLLIDLEKKYGYNDLDAFLVLKDILAVVWKSRKTQQK